jgi:CheY-like chemotaxis protein
MAAFAVAILPLHNDVPASIWTPQGNDYQRSQRILHILLVEDHDDTRRGMELFLRAHGHRTQVASGVQEAMDLAATSDTGFDLLLSDLRLPDGNGWDLLRRLEEGGWRPQQAVAVSGWGSDMDVARSKSAGFGIHLVNPIAPQVLEAVLVRVGAVPCTAGTWRRRSRETFPQTHHRK